MAFRNEAYEVQNLINIYRANPNMFDSDQLDVLQNKAIPAAPVMVHKSLDPCRGEHLWYKGYTDF